MLPEGFVNLSSLHFHRNKEVCSSEAALGWMCAHLTAVGSPRGMLRRAEQGCGFPAALALCGLWECGWVIPWGE